MYNIHTNGKSVQSDITVRLKGTFKTVTNNRTFTNMFSYQS